MVERNGLRRGGLLLAAGGLLLVLRVPVLGTVGWLVGSALVVVGVIRVRRMFGEVRSTWFLTLATYVAIVAPALEGVAMVVGQPAIGVVGTVIRVAGALVVCWTVARRLDATGRGHQARRWSLTFVTQIAVWVPIAVTLIGASAVGQQPQVEGAVALLVFAAGSAPLAFLIWAAIPTVADASMVGPA